MIHNLDCLQYLKTVPTESVDLVLTDPPYFIGFDDGKGWDSQWSNELEYLTWCQQWTDECVRVLKPNRMLVVWGTLKTDTFLQYKLMLSAYNKLEAQNEIIWSYNWGGRSKQNFARKHEYAWCYSKGKDFLFNDADIRVERKLKKNIRTGKAYTEGAIPTCIWEKNNHTTSRDYVGWHPTVKNLEILERIIRAYTNPGDTVLDCFMGSGSTAIAAMRCNREYTGTELDADYHAKIQERIRAANPLGI